jgi:probable rRNA maturation factor
MILINSRLRKATRVTEQITRDAQAILRLLGYPDFDLGILLTTNATIRRYNRDFRNKDVPTDILSFPFYPDAKPGNRIISVTEEEKNLGDIIISIEYVQKSSKKLGVSFDERLRLLLVHGICHLLGYDHISDQDHRIMRKKELQILKELNGL